MTLCPTSSRAGWKYRLSFDCLVVLCTLFCTRTGDRRRLLGCVVDDDPGGDTGGLRERHRSGCQHRSPASEGCAPGNRSDAGLDLSSTTDITAFVLVFPPTDDDDRFIVKPWFWIPEDNLVLRVNRDHVPYDVWDRQEYLETTEGNVVHYGFIEAFIEKLGERFNIREIAFDRWGGRTDGAEPGGNGLHGRSFRAGIQGYESANQGADEACAGEEGGAWRASGAQVDDGQRIHTQGPCREHQAGQGEVHGEYRRSCGDDNGLGQGDKERKRNSRQCV